MNCPDCGHDNIQGSETCEDCGHDLAGLDLPAPTNHLQKKILEDSLHNLHPAQPLTVSPDTTVLTALERMKAERYGCVFITENDRLVGIFTERDIILRLVGNNQDLAKLPVREVMTTNPEALTNDDTVAYALNKMWLGGYRHLPIVQEGKPIGLVSVRGILKFIAHNLS